jgi:hypothetical protein
MRDTDIERDVAMMFASEVKGHRMSVRHDQGLYRHLVFAAREHPRNGYFELITAPGSLTIVGDRGNHTFRRLADMFQFFRNNPDRPHHINAHYWSQKTADGGRSVQVYSEAILRQLLAQYLQEAIASRDAIQRELDEENERQREEWREGLRYDGVIDENDPDWAPFQPEQAEDWPELVKARTLVDDAQELISDYDADGALGWEDGARRLLADLEEIGLISDSWEWDLRDWDFHFLWCLNAIAWGIQQYDRAVRSGLHQIRTAPVAWDPFLPTTAPAKPEPVKQAAAEPVKFEVTMGTAHPAGAHLVTVQPQGEVL